MLDSGCTNHMIEAKSMFSSLDMSGSCQESISFVDDGMGEVMGLGRIAISNDKTIYNVLLVESLTYNLLSVSQL